jgi:hypothetical protein
VRHALAIEDFFRVVASSLIDLYLGLWETYIEEPPKDIHFLECAHIYDEDQSRWLLKFEDSPKEATNEMYS